MEPESVLYKDGNLTREQMDLVHQIVLRGEGMGIVCDNYSRITCTLDIENLMKVHRVRLNDWFESDAQDFRHDMLGIAKHMNRETGRLVGIFMPRFAQG